MWRRFAIKFSLATVKSNRPSKQLLLTLERLNFCREILSLPQSTETNISDSCQLYIKQRSSFINIHKIKMEMLFDKWSTVKPLDCQIALLQQKQKMRNEETIYLDLVMRFWGSLLLKQRVNYKSMTFQKQQKYKQILRQYFNHFNSTCYLLTLDQTMICLYLKTYNLIKQFKVDFGKYHSQLRYIFDSLLNNCKKVSESSLDYLFFFTSKFAIHSIYFTRERQIMSYLYTQIPSEGQSQHLLKNLLFSISVQTQTPGQYLRILPKILKDHPNYTIRLRSLTTMIELFMIDSATITKKQYLKVIQLLLQKLQGQAFINLSKIFYRANIWVEQFWLKYFDFLQKGDNSLLISHFHHHIIDDLLINMSQGSPLLRKRAEQFRHVMKKKGVEIDKLNLRDQYEKNFGRMIESKSSCQLHVANSMRLICSAQILTEVPIKYFNVDVLIDKTVVVQINNNFHYKTIGGQTRPNLKSQFRKRILTLAGYTYLQIKVDDYTNSNYVMMEEIYQLIQSTSNLKKIKKQSN